MFFLFQCASCKHKFIKHKFSSSDLRNLYTNYYPRSEFSVDDYKSLSYKKNFKSWFDGEERSAYTYVPKDVKILDIGCGFGQSLGYHKERGCDVYGVEADSNIEKVVEKYGFNVKVGLFDASNYKDDFFDYVTMDQVLEHTTNPIETMQGISKILKENGKLVISVPNSSGWGAKVFGKRWINWHAPYHLQHFSKKSINMMAEKANLDVVSFKTITSSEWLYYQWLSLISSPKLGDKSSFWSASKQEKSFGMKMVYKLLSILHRAKINHVITRFFDALGYGDNYIIVLKRKENL
ncbi:MAG: class I SAM-dependent methyltransferase [Bacteroidales bacterium]|nr:class I SAM-dependent methyltransferase [Bacteroidales bacterium]